MVHPASIHTGSSASLSNSSLLLSLMLRSSSQVGSLLSNSKPVTSSATPSTSSLAHSSTLTTVPSSSSSPKMQFPITSSPFNPFNLTLRSAFPTTPGPSPSNATLEAPYIAFGCTTTAGDPGHDERSCSCLSEVYTWYATQSTGELTTSVCHTAGETSYGYHFSPGCSLETSTLLATPRVAPDRCCGYCDIIAPTVRIVFWAPPVTASSNLTTSGNFSISTATTVVDNGFTL